MRIRMSGSIEKSVQNISQSPDSGSHWIRQPNYSATSLTTGYCVTELRHVYLIH
jgi:hypothetical protein